MKDQFNPEVDEPINPLEVLGEGMRPLPEDTDMDVLTAAYDLLGRLGVHDFAVAYDDQLPTTTRWRAGCTVPGRDGDLITSGWSSAHDAAERLARKVANGGRCPSCARLATLRMGDGRMERMDYCYWTRTGKRWERGCIDTHE